MDCDRFARIRLIAGFSNCITHINKPAQAVGQSFRITLNNHIHCKCDDTANTNWVERIQRVWQPKLHILYVISI